MPHLSHSLAGQTSSRRHPHTLRRESELSDLGARVRSYMIFTTLATLTSLARLAHLRRIPLDSPACDGCEVHIA
jgi:hypothetical protein